MVFIDNFSRFMYARAMKDKTAATAAKTFEKILEDWRKEFPNSEIKTILMDDGSEFKASIKIRRALFKY